MNIYMVIKIKRMDEIIEGENIVREKFYNLFIRSFNNQGLGRDYEIIRN